LLNQIVELGPLAPGSGTFTEKAIPTPPGPIPPPDGLLFEYNAELHLGKEFRQEPDTVYWLKIVALVNPFEEGPIQWGWHNRDWSIMDPYASTAPAVVPGEVPIPSPFGPVWHFQDDAVTGPIDVTINPNMPIMPEIMQPSWEPRNYVYPFDGPEGIQQYSKDLAFELYTIIPEPSTLMLIGWALAVVGLHRRRTF
jgi:hypothetical protein